MPKSVYSDAYVKLIETLVDCRRRQGVTQVELAARLNRPQSFISKIEQRQRRVDLIEFCAIAQALGVSAHELFDEVLRRLPKVLAI